MIGSLLMSPILILAAEDTKDKRLQVMNNMIKCELPDQTLAPKQKVYGFVYFKIGKESTFLDEPCQLSVQLKNLKNKNITNIIFDINK